MLGPPWAAIAHRQLRLAKLAEVIEVASSRHATHSGRLGHPCGGKPAARALERLRDQVERRVGQAFRQRLVASCAQGAKDAVHVALLGLAEASDSLARHRVGKELLLEGGK